MSNFFFSSLRLCVLCALALRKCELVSYFRFLLISLTPIVFGWFFCQQLYCNVKEDLLFDAYEEGLSVDLRNPTYENGILCSLEGGVITAANIRIQATKLIYTRKTVDNALIFNLIAEENVMVEFGDMIFIGDYLEYDFQTKCGFILRGRAAAEPWYLGGERIELLPDGNFLIDKAYVTTAENDIIDWRIQANDVWLSHDYYLKARNLNFMLLNKTVFWLPSFSADLNTFLDSPIRYQGGTGGRQGPRAGITYEFYTREQFRAVFRLDYRVKRGFRGGIETRYNNRNQLEKFYTINYLAHDNSVSDPTEKMRYRLYGLYHNQTCDGRTSLHLTYDKVSDKEMPSDYYDQGIELRAIKKTQIAVHHQQRQNFISNFITHVRVNRFQTIKQEMPSLNTAFRPITIDPLGIVSDSQCKVSYLYYKYDNDIRDVRDFKSARLELQQKAYRPCYIGPIIATPELGVTSIYYGSSPSGDPKWLSVGQFKYTVNTQLFRLYENSMHMIVPYGRYSYDTYPTVTPTKHYIFDIQDGWYRLNMLRFGLQNIVYKNRFVCQSRPYFMADFYANAFFATDTIPTVIPKTYAFLVWNPTSYSRYTLDTAWDLEHNMLDHINIRSEVTVSEYLAMAIEWRHRSAFSWRKAVFSNYILESFHTEDELLHSPLSDRRDTLLLHVFYRFRPTWALEVEARQGCRRRFQPAYFEYEIDITKTFHSAWHVKVSYQNQESDKRVAFSAYLDLYD